MKLKKVRKAVIPAAGLGTRVLPITKAIPKEMLPIIDKPAIQYLIEECAASGITDVLIITGRRKSAIEDHFDRAPELEAILSAKGKWAELNAVKTPCGLVNVSYVRQQETLGLGHAVLCAKNFVGDEPFAVLYGDDIILGGEPVVLQLKRAYEAYGLPCCGIHPVPEADIHKYSSLKIEPLRDNLYHVTDMVEKAPLEKAFSLYSILGRVLLTPGVFSILERTNPGAGGEIQLTDAMAELARSGGMTGVDFTGTHYDMGNKFAILRANIEIGLQHPEVGDQLRDYLRGLSL